MKHAYLLSSILSRCSVVSCLDCSLILFYGFVLLFTLIGWAVSGANDTAI